MAPDIEKQQSGRLNSEEHSGDMLGQPPRAPDMTLQHMDHCENSKDYPVHRRNQQEVAKDVLRNGFDAGIVAGDQGILKQDEPGDMADQEHNAPHFWAEEDRSYHGAQVTRVKSPKGGIRRVQRTSIFISLSSWNRLKSGRHPSERDNGSISRRGRRKRLPS